jgi:hypothetical protein
VVTGNPVLIPPRVAALLAAVPITATAAALTGTPNPNPWLFPGRLPGRPRNPHGLRRSLHHHGVEVRQACNAALIALAGDLPPAVLSDLFGVSITSAIAWARRSARDWTRYIQHRLPTGPAR